MFTSIFFALFVLIFALEIYFCALNDKDIGLKRIFIIIPRHVLTFWGIAFSLWYLKYNDTELSNSAFIDHYYSLTKKFFIYYILIFLLMIVIFAIFVCSVIRYNNKTNCYFNRVRITTTNFYFLKIKRLIFAILHEGFIVALICKGWQVFYMSDVADEGTMYIVVALLFFMSCPTLQELENYTDKNIEKAITRYTRIFRKNDIDKTDNI